MTTQTELNAATPATEQAEQATPKQAEQAAPAPKKEAKPKKEKAVKTGPHAAGQAPDVTPKYSWKPEARKGSEARVRLTAHGKELGANCKKPGSDTRARWEALLAAMKKAGGELPISKAREILGAYAGADLAWEKARGRIEYVTK